VNTKQSSGGISCGPWKGADGNSVSGTPVLAGLDSSHFTLQMHAFRTGQRSATVMQHHAKGLTDEEIQLLASHFARLPRTTPLLAKPAQ
jgi:cytochrome c553